MKLGDTFTIEGQYARRTFLQWLRREPRRLQKFRITEHINVPDEAPPNSPYRRNDRGILVRHYID